ncbi:MAG: SDR family NAD(P)-dependent oxidoreductase [Nannocystaceae bacterium]
MKRAMITGVTRGIGEATARMMLGDGWEVVGVYRRRGDRAEALSSEFGERLSTVACDLADSAAIDSLVRSWERSFDGVVLNAGITYRTPFSELEVDGVDPLEAQVGMDLLAPLRLLRALMREKRLANGASVVFVSSNLARRGLAGKVAYSAAKAGLEGACRGLAWELGAEGIRVNCVSPGLLATDMTAELGAEGYASYGAEVPLGRVGSVEDIAGVIRFLLGDDARYVSGQALDVDGGWSA